MNSSGDRTHSNASKLQAALLEYAGAPGKYQLSLRQPALLFGSIRQVLQLAAGRSAAGEEQAENKALMEAAAFFIRAALLFPGASHYAVLGLPPRTEPVELKERYRLLMRLIHPDFAATHAQTWPADAAVRVNRAYEVLSSPVLRAEYDEQLAAPAPQRPQLSPRMDGHAPMRAMRDVPDESASWRFNRAAVWALAIGGSLVAVAALVPWQGPDQLVQKSDAPVALAVEGAPSHPHAQPRAQTVVAANGPEEAPLALPAPPLPAPLPMPLPVPIAPAPQAPVAARAPAPAPAPLPAPAPARLLAAAPTPAPAPRAEPLQLRASASLPAPKPQAAPPARTLPAPVVVAQAPRPLPLAQVPVPEAPRPAERRIEASVPPPAPLPAPVVVVREEPVRPAPLPVAARIEAGPTGTEPSLNDAQPLLTLLLQSMEGGSGEQMLRLLESDARRAPAALALSRQYDQLVGRARPVRLSHVEFRSEAREGVLLVTGKVRLHAGEPTIGAPGERMSLRAEFVSRGGKVLLTGLSSAAD